jgi:hypothetical protein
MGSRGDTGTGEDRRRRCCHFDTVAVASPSSSLEVHSRCLGLPSLIGCSHAGTLELGRGTRAAALELVPFYSRWKTSTP